MGGGGGGETQNNAKISSISTEIEILSFSFLLSVGITNFLFPGKS